MNLAYAWGTDSQTAVRTAPKIVSDDVESRSSLLSDSGFEEPFSDYFGSTVLASSGHPLTVDPVGLGDTTPISKERLVRRHLYPRKALNIGYVDAIDSTLGDRRTLLARKYASKGGFSEEAAARLEILNEKMRKLVPSVTPKELQAVESAVAVLADVAESGVKLRASLGLD